MSTQIEQKLEKIIGLYSDFGHEEYAGEKVTQLEHGLQAAQLAKDEGYDDEVVIAALFHDIGHLLKIDDENKRMGMYGVKEHELHGAKYLLDCGFSQRIADLVSGHVKTKRYLVFKYPNYIEGLSDASIATLIYQGGTMKQEEATAFEADPLFDLHIKMREWDDKAKIVGLQTKNISDYKNIISNILLNSI